MKIRTQISQKDYINLTFSLLFKKPFVIMSIIVMIMFIMIVVYFSGAAESIFVKNYSPFSYIFLVILFGVIFPFSVYNSAKKNYLSQQRLHEVIDYEFSANTIKLTGETFSTEMSLEKSYKIVELNKWFLIYQSRQTANLVPKGNLSSAEIANLRSFFANLKGVKLKLK